MDHSDIPKLRALRDEYVRKYNENFYWGSWFYDAENTTLPQPTYNPDFWNRNRSVPYNKYDLYDRCGYTLDQIITACNKYTNIPESERKRDIECLAYHIINNNTSKFIAHKNHSIFCYFMTIEEYVHNFETINIYPEVRGYRQRLQFYYLEAIKTIESSINSCKMRVLVPDAKQNTIAQPM